MGLYVHDEDREAEIVRLRKVNRLTQREIAERLGISQQRVSEILAKAMEKIEPPDLTAIRDEALALHRDVIRRAYELVELNGAPVTAGKDGTIVMDPESQMIVRDYGGRIAALKLALDADKEIRKLAGADAATKTEISGGIRYEVAGVDVDADLT